MARTPVSVYIYGCWSDNGKAQSLCIAAKAIDMMVRHRIFEAGVTAFKDENAFVSAGGEIDGAATSTR